MKSLLSALHQGRVGGEGVECSPTDTDDSGLNTGIDKFFSVTTLFLHGVLLSLSATILLDVGLFFFLLSFPLPVKQWLSLSQIVPYVLSPLPLGS